MHPAFVFLKAKIRMSNAKENPKSEARKPRRTGPLGIESRAALGVNAPAFWFRLSAFGFPSDFG